MVLASTKLVPELNYYFATFLRNSILNKYRITYPAVLDCPCLDENKSFIRLLFDDNWPKTYTLYTYLYREVNITYWPEAVRTRLALYPISGTSFVSDADSTADIDLFHLQDDDTLMLDKLLEYRTADSTSIVTLTMDYVDLSTNLSKMIFLYLDLKINGSYERYNDEVLISGEYWQSNHIYTLGEWCVESHVLAWFKCTTLGISGPEEPAWNFTLGTTTIDGTVIWTACVPKVLESCYEVYLGENMFNFRAINAVF